jgi:hypothetical protein
LESRAAPLLGNSEHRTYRYDPFHRFEFTFTSVVLSHWCFVHSTTSGTKLLINPDLWLFFKLEEKTSGRGTVNFSLVSKMPQKASAETSESRLQTLRSGHLGRRRFQ